MVFFFNDTATTEIYTLSLHDALPIWSISFAASSGSCTGTTIEARRRGSRSSHSAICQRSEEHTSELQSRQYLVCRLLLEKKNRDCAVPPIEKSVVRVCRRDAPRLVCS